jgi:hypothetical protein
MIKDKHVKDRWFAAQISFGLLLLVIILFLSQSWFSIPQAVLKMYSLTDVENVSIIFDEKGCSIIKQLGIRYTGTDKSNTCSINHATIISDIGNDRLIDSEERKRFAVSKSNSTVVKLPAPTIKTVLTEFVGKNGKLSNIKAEFKDSKSEIKGLSVIITIIDNQGKILKRDLVKQNITVGFNNDPIEYLLPVNLPADNDIWCDLEIVKDGIIINNQLVRITAFN